MKYIISFFAVIGLISFIFTGIMIAFIEPQDDTDCQSGSDLFEKYRKQK